MELSTHKISLEDAKRIKKEACEKADTLKIRYAAYMVAYHLGRKNEGYHGYRVEQWIYEGIHGGRTWVVLCNEGIDKTTRITVDGVVVLDSWRRGSYQVFRDGDWIADFGRLFEEAKRISSNKAYHAQHDEIAALLQSFAPMNARILTPA